MRVFFLVLYGGADSKVNITREVEGMARGGRTQKLEMKTKLRQRSDSRKSLKKRRKKTRTSQMMRN